MGSKQLDVGSFVVTPSGRVGVIVAFTYGARGDLPRAAVRYMDRINDEVPLQLKLLRTMPTSKSKKPKKKPAQLSAKQKRFIEEYAVDCNASAAARRAGYATKSAGVIGYKLLGRPEIAKAVEERLKQADARAELSADFVRKFWKQAIKTCAQEVLATTAEGMPLIDRDGNKVYKNLDANSLRNLLADVAKHLQMFEKDDGAKDADAGTGVMKVPGVASKEDWNGQ